MLVVLAINTVLVVVLVVLVAVVIAVVCLKSKTTKEDESHLAKSTSDTDGYQTRPTYEVSGGVFVVENDKHYLVRGSAYKINDKNS